ncbi:hypothetical protein PQC39_gp011 [Vibrio phage Vp_R1]|uniref:Uncharacterized protein n=1 Tax=Vibrio phage Vp_R1 TaxID=2059867 RepID=A0A2H5BPY6_9CAUD|nr:hypothetical protein PQC39_gp011 [Vibrio phage Vp_R1]AUG88375.1 hypothetical protein VPR_011 [Vibrio phage Vp_R1]
MSELDKFHMHLLERKDKLISKRVVVHGLSGAERWVALSHNAKIKLKVERLNNSIEMIEIYKDKYER